MRLSDIPVPDSFKEESYASQLIAKLAFLARENNAIVLNLDDFTALVTSRISLLDHITVLEELKAGHYADIFGMKLYVSKKTSSGSLWQRGYATVKVMYSSVGILRYHDEKLIVEVDQQLGKYYFALVPKWFKINPQKYAPHISVVRKEIPPNKQYWKKYDGESIEFVYDSFVYSDETYFWLNAFCNRLEEIRAELGLPVSSPYTRPPSGFHKCFHITIGNLKWTNEH